ncbi:hypothetical protein IMG5_001050 [Ichthyophthirius multifiliis]|uniref:Uncharacterized protein n=1 Tax=Ichthyophthirius multifiliis TaxID=5932 RepID=G0QIP6_ICHMU|nr:hypothetical protein IMG5_001050 [Ichthyophthirius multifiliis]EGR34876.1 hypothetical protein IMG5_001050 [Ichthyophthirius multifiliis]|eukprot:XP_004040180.1 hypothetical protein IMG5_001050 [Ichthyophthirius multifiliis]
MSQQQNLTQGAIGIDFGSSRSVIAVAKRGGVDILTNEASLRETRNIVGYGPKQRFMGEAGNAQAKSNFKNTVSNFNRLLGLPPTHPKLRNETKWITSKIATNQDGKLVHEVQYKNETVQFLPEQVTGAMLGALRNIVSSHNLPNHEAVISVPSYYTEQERKALRDACLIAGLNPTRLFNESSAISISYGLFRKAELDSTVTRNVAFIDLGHSKFSAFVSSFNKEKSAVLAQVHDRQLGARDMDWLIFQKYAKSFEQKTGLSPYESKKAMLRLFDAIGKQRTILSANMESECNCEYLMEDCDLSESLTRSEFESIIQPVLAQIQQCLQTLIQELKNKKIELHSVEIIGGATRIPIVQEMIKKSFGIDTLNKTLNASECIARGCAMMAAMMSPLFKVAEYNLEESNYYAIKTSWDFFNLNEKGQKVDLEGGKSSVIFEKGCTIPNVKSITFTKSDGININLFYDNPSEGFDGLLANYVIQPCKPKEQTYSVKVRIKLDKNGLVSIDEVQLIEDYQVEEKIPIKKDNKPTVPAAQQPQQQQNQADNSQQQQPANNVDNQQQQQQEEVQQEYEIKMRKKTRYTNLQFDQPKILYSLLKEQIDMFINLQISHINFDNVTINTLFKKNELESFIYAWRAHLDGGSYQQYALPNLVHSVLHELRTYEQWLYEHGQEAPLNDYGQRLEKVQQMCAPIQRRYNEYSNLPDSINQLQKIIQESEGFVISGAEQYAHISKEERKPIADEVDRIRIFLNNAEIAQKRLQLHQDPVITCEEVQKQINSLINICKPIMSKSKPEPKKEEKMQTENDANNQNNNANQKPDEKMDIEK